MWANLNLKKLASLAACAVLAQCSPVSDYADGPVVDVGYARYRGAVSYNDTAAYLGVPYAQSPTGERRFRAPVPLNTQKTSSSIVDASEYPEPCIQGSTGGGDAGGAGSEDCLKVNVYAPLNATKESNLPVLVYIHGGGYVYGNPANWPFEHWTHQSPNVVIVSVYYRLDSFGFLAHPAFRSDSSLGDLNPGFLDQAEALRWVKKHISSFGGNPGKVTIDGQSAGGSSVELHLVANEGEELFQAAIPQSVYRTPVGPPEEREPQFEQFIAAAKCSEQTLRKTMACLRKASVSALSRAQDAVSDFNVTVPYNLFTPVIDGKVITQNPTKSILEGKFHKVPLLVGSTTNESLSDTTTLDAPLKEFFPALTNKTLAEYAKVYSVSEFGDEVTRNTYATGESELRCARSILGLAWSGQGLSTFTYRFNEPANPDTATSDLVFHSAENWWMFRGTNTGFNGTTTFTDMTPSEDAFSEELIAYWLSFVRAHDPTTFKLERSPEWPKFTPQALNRIALQRPIGADANSTTVSGSTIEKQDSAETKRCEFVASIEREQED
ncbi:alpha/beta-hydrolase [Peniophora sp. CONT]|nr:alpha/beta-hydrolase [Peniophora sp. CONT]